MPPKACRVSFTNPDGVEHAVEVLADSLFEAAGLGLRMLKRDGWVNQEPGPLTRILVEVREPATQHSLTVQQLKRWAGSSAVSPAERLRKERLKLGHPERQTIAVVGGGALPQSQVTLHVATGAEVVCIERDRECAEVCRAVIQRLGFKRVARMARPQGVGQRRGGER